MGDPRSQRRDAEDDDIGVGLNESQRSRLSLDLSGVMNNMAVTNHPNHYNHLTPPSQNTLYEQLALYIYIVVRVVRDG